MDFIFTGRVSRLPGSQQAWWGASCARWICTWCDTLGPSGSRTSTSAIVFCSLQTWGGTHSAPARRDAFSYLFLLRIREGIWGIEKRLILSCHCFYIFVSTFHYLHASDVSASHLIIFLIIHSCDRPYILLMYMKTHRGRRRSQARLGWDGLGDIFHSAWWNMFRHGGSSLGSLLLQDTEVSNQITPSGGCLSQTM